jgi:Csm1 N-terminal domain
MSRNEQDTKDLFGGYLPRAQSNLDILSQTAAVIEESISSAQSSPYPSARVTPADYSSVTSPFKEHLNNRKTFLALPDMPLGSQHQPPHRTIFLEQKKGFLPPALPFEPGTSGSGIQVDSVGVESSPEYSPGIYLAYANGHGSSSTTLMMRNSSPPFSMTAEQQHQLASANASGLDTATNQQRSATPTVAGSNDTVVHSILGTVNSFSSGTTISATLSVPVSYAPPRSTLQHYHHGSGEASSNSTLQSPTRDVEFTNEIVRENFLLRQQLSVRDSTIDALQAQVDSLQQEIRQLRQLPTGKISQIPLEYVHFATSFGPHFFARNTLHRFPSRCSSCALAETCFPSCMSTDPKCRIQPCRLARRLYKRLPSCVSFAVGIQHF